MRFFKKDMRLVSVRPYTKQGTEGKADKTFYFVKIADKQTYENEEFMLSTATDPHSLFEGKDYDVVLEKRDRFSDIELIPVKYPDVTDAKKPA